jgi:hypothetical protein
MRSLKLQNSRIFYHVAMVMVVGFACSSWASEYEVEGTINETIVGRDNNVMLPHSHSSIETWSEFLRQFFNSCWHCFENEPSF